MPAHHRLDDPAFVERLEHAMRLRRDGHLTLRKSAEIAGIPKTVLANWEWRLRNGKALRATETMRSLVAGRKSSRVHTKSPRERMTVIAPCPTCRAPTLWDGLRLHVDVIATMPWGGWLGEPHRCCPTFA